MKKKQNPQVAQIKQNKQDDKSAITASMIASLDKQMDLYLRTLGSPDFCVNHSIPMDSNISDTDFDSIKNELQTHYAGFSTEILLVEDECSLHLCAKLTL